MTATSPERLRSQPTPASAARSVDLSPVSPFCQRWAHGRHSWRHLADGGFDAARFEVIPVPEAIARPFVTRHHYAASYPASRLAYGLVTDDDRYATDTVEVDGRLLVGVAVLSVPMRADVLTRVFPDLEPYTQTLELGRFVLTNAVPANAESWMIARVWRHAATTGLRGVVSFADPMPRRRQVVRTDPDGSVRIDRQTLTPGHVGALYQAAGGRACGRSTPRTLTYLPRHGLVVSDRTLSKVRRREVGADGAERQLVALGARARRAEEDPRTWLTDALADLDATKVRHPGNFRYAWPLGTPAQRRRVTVALPSTGYPKAATHLMPDPHPVTSP